MIIEIGEKYEEKKTPLNKFVEYIFYAFCLILPISVSILRYYTTVDKLENNEGYNKKLNLVYLITLQLCFIFASTTLVFLISALRRIQSYLQNNKRLLANENFMKYHIFAFGLFFLNLLIYDVLVCFNFDSPFP